KADELVEKYPYYAADTVPEGTYGLEEDVDTVAVLAMLAVTDNISEDAVYDITKAIYENTDQISHAKGELITLESALDGIDINLLKHRPIIKCIRLTYYTGNAIRWD